MSVSSRSLYGSSLWNQKHGSQADRLSWDGIIAESWDWGVLALKPCVHDARGSYRSFAPFPSVRYGASLRPAGSAAKQSGTAFLRRRAPSSAVERYFLIGRLFSRPVFLSNAFWLREFRRRLDTPPSVP